MPVKARTVSAFLAIGVTIATSATRAGVPAPASVAPVARAVRHAAQHRGGAYGLSHSIHIRLPAVHGTARCVFRRQRTPAHGTDDGTAARRVRRDGAGSFRSHRALGRSDNGTRRFGGRVLS